MNANYVQIEQRMPIEKQDGTKYVEVHHIKKSV